MIKIKKGINLIIFAEMIPIIPIAFILTSVLCDEEMTNREIMTSLCCILIIMIVGLIALVLYIILCPIYYEITMDQIIVKKKKKVLKNIEFNKIVYCDYYGIGGFFFGFCGMTLTVHYIEGCTMKEMNIPFCRSLLKKFNIPNVIKRGMFY